MTGEHDDVVLSEAELERLAAIEATLARNDPALVTRLGRHERISGRARLWMAGPLVTVVFVVVVVATFTRWLWAALGGLGLMTAGVLLVSHPLATRVMADIAPTQPVSWGAALNDGQVKVEKGAAIHPDPRGPGRAALPPLGRSALGA